MERSRPADTDDEFFFDRIAQITDAEWESRYWCYLYRIAPKINIAGDRHHIARLSARFDEQDILAKYGSGQYYARLNDKKVRKTVATHVFSVYHPDKPPVCDLSLIVDCPENEPYLKWITRKSDAPITADTAAVGELAKLCGKVLDQRTAPAPANGLTEATTTLLLGMATGRDQLAQQLASHPSANADPIAAVDRVVDLLKKMQPEQGKHVDPVTALHEAVDLIRAVQPTAAPVDPMTQFKGFLEMLKQTKELVGVPENDGGHLAAVATTRRSKMSGWQEMLQPAIPVVVDFLKPFAAQLATSLFTRAGQPAPVNGQATQPPSPAVPQAQQQNGAMPPLLNMIAPALLNYMRMDADAHELGEDFASWVHEGFQADARFNSAIAMARAAGPNVIIAQFKGSSWWTDRGAGGDLPSLSQMEGKFEIFTQAFLNWQPQQAGMESDAPEVIDIG